MSVSKNLKRILCHAATDEGFRLMRGGFLYIDDLLQHRSFYGVTLEQVQEIVDKDDRNLFTIQRDEQCNILMICANYGHSLYFDKTHEQCFNVLRKILRHKAEEEGLLLMKGGFLYVDDLLKLKSLEGCTIDQIEAVAFDKRLHISKDKISKRLMIRETYGHSLKFEGQRILNIHWLLINILRHFASELGFTLMKGGFLYVDDLLQHKYFERTTHEDIRQICRESKNFCLQIDETTDKLKIRAKHGHTLPFEGNTADVFLYTTLKKVLKRKDTYTSRWKLSVLEGGFV